MLLSLEGFCDVDFEKSLSQCQGKTIGVIFGVIYKAINARTKVPASIYSFLEIQYLKTNYTNIKTKALKLI